MVSRTPFHVVNRVKDNTTYRHFLAVERLILEQPILDLAVRRHHQHRFLHKYILCIHQDHLFVKQTYILEELCSFILCHNIDRIYTINVLLYHRPTVKTTDIA